MQLDKEEQQGKEMIKAMQEQTLHIKEIAMLQAELKEVMLAYKHICLNNYSANAYQKF